MTWIVRRDQFVRLPFLFVALLSAFQLSCGKKHGGGVFAFDQEAHVASLAPELPETVVAQWHEVLATPNLEALLAERPKTCPAVLCQAAEQWFNDRGGERALVSSTYELSPAAEQLRGLLAELHLHALPRERFRVDAIDAIVEELRQTKSDARWVEEVQIEEPLLEDTAALFPAESRRDRADLTTVAAAIAESDAEEIKAVREAYEEEGSELVSKANALEWLLTLAWLEYVDVMNASIVQYWDEETLLEVGLVVPVEPGTAQSEDDDERNTSPKTIAAWRARVRPSKITEMTNTLRLRKLAEEVQVLATEKLRERAAALEPPFEHYAALKRVFAQYLAIAAAGGWETDLKFSRAVAVGRRSSELPRLRERLRAEGYNIEVSDEKRLDQALSDVVKEYQAAHQLDETGEPNRVTARAMNLSVETRIGQIAAAMQAWRENPIGRDHTGYRVEVNVPDFHAEVWDGKELLSRFRVIVGQTTPPRADSDTETKLFSDRISRIVLNPYWNVPQSIVTGELRDKRKKNRNYYEENNFEVRRGRSRTYVRQRPGPDNALGRVKFLFPNEFAIYMHDTPERERRLFSRSSRAYSHGCVRVQDPLDFAELLISRDRDWTRRKAREFIEEALSNDTVESHVTIEAPVPIHIFYIPMNVVDGRPQFLSDIYGRMSDAVEQNAGLVKEWLNARAPEEPRASVD